ncbi:hypothetical protein IW150_002358 [Coemansia sp. RSA 2607]|nr:hypothetical protein IW150_002358 [Coemansia sp. RSA 2607]KAJ2387332.1 hypothetical protein GGI05_004113 [Coemansia sp. RSA 2603]
MGGQLEESQDNELLHKFKSVLERSIADLNSAGGTSIQLQQFVEAFDPQCHTIQRLMSAVVKETLAPRRPSEPTSPSASLRGTSLYGSFRGGNSPAVDGSGSWMGSVRRGRVPSSSVDLDHVRNLMEAIEIVSPHMVGADVATCGSPIPESRSGWSLPGQAAHSLSEQHSLAASFGVASGDAHSHAMRHRRTSAQTAHAAGIPIRPARPRGRGGHIDPIEFAEYAVAHMRPSPRFTPMGHGFPMSSSMVSEPRASLPRSFRGGHMSQALADAARSHTMQLPRQHGVDEMHQASASAQELQHAQQYHHLRHTQQQKAEQQPGNQAQGVEAEAEMVPERSPPSSENSAMV